MYHFQGEAQVLKVFRLNDKAATVVAGLSVTTGKMKIGPEYLFRVVRNNTPVGADDRPACALKRFKEDVQEVGLNSQPGFVLRLFITFLLHLRNCLFQVPSGYECGLSLEGFSDYSQGDEIQCYHVSFKNKELSLSDEHLAEDQFGKAISA